MELLQQGRQAFDQGLYEQAITIVEAAIASNPHDHLSRHVRALAYFKLGQYDTAIVEFDWLVAKHPSDSTYVSDRAVALHRKGDHKAALADFEQAILLEPTRAYHYACRAYIKDRMGDVEGAVVDYKKAIQLDPEDEIAKNNLEITQQKLGYKASKLFRHKSKAHFSEEEQQAYEAAYLEKHGAIDNPEVSVVPAKPTTKALLQEMGKVFTSKAARKDFIAFLTRGAKR